MRRIDKVNTVAGMIELESIAPAPPRGHPRRDLSEGGKKARERGLPTARGQAEKFGDTAAILEECDNGQTKRWQLG